jgi:CBS domain-containing protein
LKEKNRKIIEINGSVTVSEALKVLAENNILSVPVWDKNDGDYLGFLDVLDIVNYVVNMYTVGTSVKEVQWEKYCTDLELLQHRGIRFGMKPIKEIINASRKDEFIPVYGHGTVYQLIEGVFYKGIHRAPIMDELNKVRNCVTQSDVMEFIGKHMEVINPKLGGMTVGQLQLGTKDIITMSANSLAIHAFWEIYANRVSAVAVVNSSGSLVANLSASDIRGLQQQHFSSLLLPVTQYLIVNKGKPQAPLTCTKDTDFSTILMKMVLFRIHRVWIVNEKEQPVGVISQTDIMKKLSEFQTPPTSK